MGGHPIGSLLLGEDHSIAVRDVPGVPLMLYVIVVAKSFRHRRVLIENGHHTCTRSSQSEQPRCRHRCNWGSPEWSAVPAVILVPESGLERRRIAEEARQLF